MAPIYSQAQVAKFLAYLKVPQEFYLGEVPILDHPFLTVLHQHMITTVPYENLDLHYSSERAISLDPETLYNKFIAEGRCRGGYCKENSLFFCYMLRALGFQVYPVGVRVRPRVNGVPTGGYMGWVHIVNIVTLSDNTRWVVDVAFGGDGPTLPMPLEDGAQWRNMGTQDARLVRDFMPGQTELTGGRRMWIYQLRNSPNSPWASNYAFSHSVEWLPTDFEVTNCYTQSPQSFATWRVLVVKFLLRASRTTVTGEEVYGKRMLVDGVIKENLGGKTVVVRECATEGERVQALRDYFDLELTAEEREAIRGHKTELAA